LETTAEYQLLRYIVPNSVLFFGPS